MKEIDFQMKVATNKWKVNLLCFVMALVVAVSFIASRSNSKLEGVFTNSKTDECASFISVEFMGNTFVSILNIPVTPNAEMSEQIVERIQISEDGYYFIQIVQQGNFSINNDVYTEGITLLFPCGGIRHHPFSRTRNAITIRQSHLIAL